MPYKVRLYMDNIYEVCEWIWFDKMAGNWDVKYQGSLSDCEAWIRLHEKGYMD